MELKTYKKKWIRQEDEYEDKDKWSLLLRGYKIKMG